MADAPLPLVHRRFGATMRRDRWWVQPAVVFLVLSSFIVYATWAAFQGDHYTYGPYLSPFYSPELFGSSPHAWFGPKPGWWPAWLPFSPALLILPFPGLFRLTCYYYRGAYYKAFWADPPACAVGEPRKTYWGEASFPLILQNIHRYFLYVALLFLLVLLHDVWKALWFTDAAGRTSFGIGVGHARARDQRRPARRLHPRLPFDAARDRRVPRPAVAPPGAPPRLRLLQLPQPRPHALGLVEPLLRRVRRPLRPALLDGHLDRLEDPLTDYQTFEHDVLVIGAGGAGLRAAIAAAAPGARVGLVCKSLLGKAHTVMAEGGVAAALANVDDRDSWQVHFADTMRGGQYLNNWRMAELHAKEAPDRVRELEAWGALFDRTPDGRILQRNFGGHKYPRLAHVGDRTGLEMIRTLQDHGIHQGIDVHMECTVLRLFTGRRADRGRPRLRPRARPVPTLQLQGHRARHRRHRPGVRDHQQQLGVHRRRPRARLSRRRGAAGHGVRAVPSHRDDLAAERARHPGDRGGARRGRRAAQQRRPPLHVRRHSRELPLADGRQ